MKIFFLILLTLSVSSISAQEVSLYNSAGEATAYIDYDEDATIFMWDGTPVAFIEKDGSDLCVFGFNGSFLGWFESGIIYDRSGYVVGARKGAVGMTTGVERAKRAQRATPPRPASPATPAQPAFRSSWSKTSLIEFLYYGKR
jgi:hypothetical protein